MSHTRHTPNAARLESQKTTPDFYICKHSDVDEMVAHECSNGDALTRSGAWALVPDNSLEKHPACGLTHDEVTVEKLVGCVGWIRLTEKREMRN